MSRNSKVAQAFRAMKNLGVDEDKVKPVLKKLLQVYDKNWEMIEAENYRVLADAIFDEDDKVPEQQKGAVPATPEKFEDDDSADEPERPLKRTRLSHPQGQPSTYDGNCSPTSIRTSPKAAKEEMDELPHGTDLGHELPCNSGDGRTGMQLTSSTSASLNHMIRDKGKKPLFPQVASSENEFIQQERSLALCIKEPESLSRTNLQSSMPEMEALMIPKEEPIDEIVHDEVPLSVIHPDVPEIEDSSVRMILAEAEDAQVPPASEPTGEENMSENGSVTPSRQGPCSEVARVSEEFSPSLEVASSGEVKIYLSCSSAHGRSNFHMPSLDELIKSMEDRCLRSYKILDPKFSVTKLMKDMCECFLELATDTSNESQEELRIEVPNVEVLKKSSLRDSVGVAWNGENILVPPTIQNGSSAAHCSANGSLKNSAGNELVVVPEHHFSSDDLRSINNKNDITKGEERVPVPWVNDISRDIPPSFYYISQNLVFQSACVNFSLSRIKEGSCCPACFGDCLMSATPCQCHLRGGKEFAYTAGGVVKEDFLDQCISMTRDPLKQSFLNCSMCPLEKARNDEFIEPCKGHLKRKVIKECCCKCGCSKLCGNRVLQRGINYKLQVFFTQNGKGWGLRTLENLPKGAFICEFVGEILTVSELYARNTEKRAHLVLLDTNWPLKGVSEDEKALCLDATSYGNVARFINHRCLDANLIEIPVEVETQDLHYYHLAFFTTREVNALEELTWDYGIDFDDQDHPVKGFQCKCGSNFCRIMKRSDRSGSTKIIR